MLLVISLIVLPLIIALIIPFSDRMVRDRITIALVVSLSFLAICLSLDATTLSFSLNQSIKTLFTLIDIGLLLFFLWVGVRAKHQWVTLLAVAQLILFSYVLLNLPHEYANDITIDALTRVMFLIINLVGGTIVIYALGYIEHERFSAQRKNLFIALLVLFLGIMNLVVSTNNIEIFFLAFELTTLSSYLLIGYRQDEQSKANSLLALWMNQIGGVAILIALIASISLYQTIYFDTLITQANDYILLPIVFLIFAAYVKGAAFPFHSWLLGAMVAPTPVSAILHSATMVKIAPFLILKLAPAFSPFVASSVALFGGFVFMVASWMALNRDFFKEVLALSTVGLLSLMMALGALGNEKATSAAMILMLFHAISKALLFLQAGVLEKIYHQKYISQIHSLIEHAPKSIFFILIAFASLTLPPFGAFIGKFIAIEAISQTLFATPINIVVLLFLIFGSIMLTILYFKVASNLLALNCHCKPIKEELPVLFLAPSWFLLSLLSFGIYLIYEHLGATETLLAFIAIVSLPLLSRITFTNFKQTREYNCGEIDNFVVSSYYFDLKWQNRLIYGALIFWVVLLVGGMV